MKRTSRLMATGLAATGVVATAGVAAALGMPTAAPATSNVAHAQATSAVIADLERQLAALTDQTTALQAEELAAAKALRLARHAQIVAAQQVQADAAAAAAAAQRATQQAVNYSSSTSSSMSSSQAAAPKAKTYASPAPSSHGSTGASGSTSSSNGDIEGGNDD
jgi:Mg-chelatase subunit ChlI